MQVDGKMVIIPVDAQMRQRAMNIIPPPVGSHEDCRVCRKHHIPTSEQKAAPPPYKLYAGRLTDNEAQTAIDHELQAISDDSAYIKSMLGSYGDAILRRWTKWKAERRGDTLSNLAPACFGGKFHPAVKYARPAGTAVEDWTFVMPSKDSGTPLDMSEWACEKYKHGCSRMTPWIYIEEFADDPMRLMALLHLRSEYTSRDWAGFDTRQTFDILGQRPLSFIPAIFNAKCVKMHGSDYGRLTDCDPSMIHTGAIFGFPRAHLTFRVQSTITGGLRKIVDAIVQGVEPSGDTKWSDLASQGFQNSVSGLRWGAYFNEAFVPPSNFDPMVLLGMAGTQLNYVKDRVEFLQTDQEHMREYALQMKAGIHWETNVSPSLKWTCVAGTIVRLWTTSLLQWQAIYDVSEKLVETCRTHCVALCPGTTLPTEVATVLQEWISLVEDTLQAQIYFLRAALIDMRALRGTYTKAERNGKLYGQNTFPQHNWATQHDFDDVENPSYRIEMFVLLVLGAMQGDNPYGSSCACEQLLTEISKLEPDERVDDAISTLAVLDAMRLQYLSKQLVPYHRAELTGNDLKVKRLAYGMWMMWPERGIVDLEFDPKHYAEYGSLLRRLCEIKWPDTSDLSSEHHKATAANLLDRSHQVTEARACLKAFWQGVRNNWSFLCTSSTGHTDMSVYQELVGQYSLLADKIRKYTLAKETGSNKIHRNHEILRKLQQEQSKVNKGLREQAFPCLNALVFGCTNDSVIKKAFKHMSFDLSPKYLAAVEKERELFRNKIQSTFSVAQNKTQAQALQSTWGAEPTGGHIVASGQGKVKRNGVAMEHEVPAPKEEQATVSGTSLRPELADHKLTIPVKQDSLDLFTDMFSKHSAFGNIRWESFVHAMADAGYSATEAEGCRVSFAGEQGSNVLHQPHDRTVNPVMLRRFGKSFNSRFGWDSGTFVLRPKTDAQLAIEEPKKKKKSKSKKPTGKAKVGVIVEGEHIS